MNMQSLLAVSLVLHIIGLTTVAGVTLVSYITSKQFLVHYTKDKQKGIAIMQVTSKFPKVAGIGLLLLILSGAMLISATNGVYGQQLWFRIKMIIVIAIIAGNVFLSRRWEKRLREWVLEDVIQGNKTQQIRKLVRSIGGMQLFLLSLFIGIFILSVFRFN